MNSYNKIILTLLLFSQPLYADTAPLSWYSFDHADYQKTSLKTNRSFAKKIHRTTRVLDHSLNNFQTSYKKKTWKPVAIAAGFSLTSSGTFGIMATGGTATAGLVWLPRTQKITKNDPIPFTDGISQHDNYSIGSANHLNEDLEPAIQAVLQNKNIQISREEAHKAFTEVSSKMLELASQVPEDVKWKPLMIQSSIYFSVGGRWSTILTASSVLQIGLTWRNGPRPTPFKKLSNFTYLIDNLSQQLERAAITTPFGEHPVAAIFGVSASGGGDIGVGYAQGGLNFSISLSRTTQPTKPNIASKKVNILTNKTPHHFQNLSKKTPSHSEVIPQRLVKGFKKSMKIGRFFIRRFRNHHGYWRPRVLFLGFQISGAGRIVLATAQADVKMTLIYLIPERKKS
ncbi:MAG: hypothetical protein AB8C84_00255 [Oligoflexales bacterium]